MMAAVRGGRPRRGRRRARPPPPAVWLLLDYCEIHLLFLSAPTVAPAANVLPAIKSGCKR
jgi:hypothetical protein